MNSHKCLRNRRGCDCFDHSTPCKCVHPYEGELESDELFMELVEMVTNALVQVLIICGVHEAKARSAADVIIRAFIHYDEVRHRVDALPRKRLAKADLIHEFGLKCLMSRLEAQLSYSLVKRAFKAFYHGTCEGSCLRNPLLEAQLVHTQECAWVHAAKRSAQIFAAYEGLFFAAQRDCEARIRSVYRELYDQLKKHADMLQLNTKPTMEEKPPTYDRPKKLKVSVYMEPNGGSTHSALSAGGYIHLAPCDWQSQTCGLVADMLGLEVPQEKAAVEHEGCNAAQPAVSKHANCQCSRLASDSPRAVILANMDALMSSECSQGPFICRWLPFTDTELADEAAAAAAERAKFCLTLADDHECPIDCASATRETSDEQDPAATCRPCESPPVCAEDVEEADICEDDGSSDYELDDTESFDNNAEEAEEGGDTDALERSDQSYAGCCVLLQELAEELEVAEQLGDGQRLPTAKHKKLRAHAHSVSTA